MYEARKHISQMTPKEIELLKLKLKRMRPKYSEYARKRLYERSIPKWKIDKVLKLQDIEEFHIKGKNKRVLLSGSGYSEESKLYVVIDIESAELVTAFFCKEKGHKSKRSYDSKLDIYKILVMGGI